MMNEPMFTLRRNGTAAPERSFFVADERPLGPDSLRGSDRQRRFDPSAPTPA